ncbi:MAG TPA: hypothetical protein VGB34_01725 [Candidatus Limnocylindria bacterium]|jgi:hypothetical protein
MKHRWTRLIGSLLLLTVLALGGCTPSEGGGDGGAPADGADPGGY